VLDRSIKMGRPVTPAVTIRGRSRGMLVPQRAFATNTHHSGTEDTEAHNRFPSQCALCL